MATASIETDYLIVGAGAVGMAFADVLLSESDADIVIVDSHHQPGGHWNDAYPFVRLHQPSSFYGVSSRQLGSGKVDAVGLNQGLYELATGAEVRAYFVDVMQQQFLPSGRVRFFPMSDYIGDGQFVSRLSGETHTVTAKRHVDATWLKTSVPSTHTPSFSIADGVRFVTPNQLPDITEPPSQFVIVGGGKTGIDTAIWLLEQGVDAARIQWIMPRDAWLLNRKKTQPGIEFFEHSIGAQADQMAAIAEATSIEDLFDRLEAAGVMLRIDRSVRPEMFHGATVSEAEVDALRQIEGIVRMGRVSEISPGKIVLDGGTLEVDPEAVLIDYSARAIPNTKIKPVFEGDTITPQTVRAYQPVFSAAFIAHIELAYRSDAVRNQYCSVVPLPDSLPDWLHMTAINSANQFRWSQEPELRRWLRANRLDGFGKIASEIPKDDMDKRAVIQRLRENAAPAMANLQRLAAAAG